LVLKGLQNFFNVFFWLHASSFPNMQLALLYFHFFYLVLVVIFQDLCRVKDLFAPVSGSPTSFLDQLVMLSAFLALLVEAALQVTQQHLGVRDDTVQRGHLLVAEIRFQSVLVATIGGGLTNLDDLSNVLDKDVHPVSLSGLDSGHIQLVYLITDLFLHHGGHWAVPPIRKLRAVALSLVWHRAQQLPVVRADFSALVEQYIFGYAIYIVDGQAFQELVDGKTRLEVNVILIQLTDALLVQEGDDVLVLYAWHHQLWKQKWKHLLILIFNYYFTSFA
jgi:hypothetical protein